MNFIDYMGNDYKRYFINSELSLKDYELMLHIQKKKGSAPYLKTILKIPDLLPIGHTKQYVEESQYLKDIINSGYWLIEERNELDKFNLVNSNYYQLMKVKQIIPKNILPQYSFDLKCEIHNYHKLIILERYFNNKGKVYYSESIINCQYLRSYRYEFQLLEMDGVIRKCTEDELSLTLNFKTLKELQNIATKLRFKLNFNNTQKKDLVNLLSHDNRIKKLKINEYFYVLTENYQLFKDFLVDQSFYYTYMKY